MAKPQLYETKTETEKAILIGIITQEITPEKSAEYLDELEFLAKTADVECVKRFTQRLEHPNSSIYLGQGKIDEIAKYIEDNEIDAAIFDDELSPSQYRNISKIFKCKIIDRSNLILDIFAKRAQTAHSKTQVELAQYQYLLPRLAGMWTHLERQKGGIGMRGPGEKEIETDRRIVRDRIARLKEELQRIDNQKNVQRKNRGKLVRVALVGYTNVGKSTLMNLWSHSEVFAENKLFATLDTTVRKVVVKNLPFLLSDTVGFIRQLPKNLFESFKSTLDEVTEADILVIVNDISHPNFEEQLQTVNDTIAEITKEKKSVFYVFNKIDNYTYDRKDDDDLTERTVRNYDLQQMEDYIRMKYASTAPCIFISAKNKTNLDELKEAVYVEARRIHTERYPYDDLLYVDEEEDAE
ncbi:MAG: GTPase HflX [Bacteroidales bacterium]|nr:GTPase HflX [Bacteroidales bacterium]MBR4274276.1 GTPase HflX [Bacteroidales bacterium]